MLTNRTPGSANTVREAVVKSLHLVPMPITTSARAASSLAAVVPVAPIAPAHSGSSKRMVPLPAWVCPTGMPNASANAFSACVASE